MRDSKINDVRRTINKKDKKIRANRGKMRRFYLTSTTYPLSQGRKKANDTVVTHPTKVLQALTRKKMRGVRKGTRTMTKKRKRTRRRKKQARREAGLNSSEEREREGDEGRQDNQDPEGR